MKQFVAGCLLLVFASSLQAEFPQFKPQVLDPNAGNVCYAVTVADVNNDKKLDAVVVTENRVLWFENPSWKPHVIIENQTERDNVCIAPHDIDGDGNVDFALGAGWTKKGTLQWLRRGKSLADKWKVHYIGQEVWTHRMRFADVLGTGKPQLVVSPLNKTQGNGVRLTAFSIPKNPQTDRWQPTVLDGSLNRMHNHWHNDVNGDGLLDTLTASQEGPHLITRKSTDEFTKTKIGTGSPGAGEIKIGSLGKNNKRRFVATVEPMHGTALVVYLEQKDGTWKRQVLDNTLKRGHALWLGDLDGDGQDEIALGHSDKGTGEIKGPGVFVYDTEDNGTTWKKHVIDNGGIATEDLVLADFDGDGDLDILACGRATHNVKLYWNTRLGGE